MYTFLLLSNFHQMSTNFINNFWNATTWYHSKFPHDAGYCFLLVFCSVLTTSVSDASKNKLQAAGRHNMPPPRPASDDMIYIKHACGSVTNCSLYWPASTANQRWGLVTLTLDLLTLKVVYQSHVTCAIPVPMLVSQASLFTTQAQCTRQTDVRHTDRRQTTSPLNAVAQGAGIIKRLTFY